ncbi:lipid kinase YegS [Vibrio sp. UCD-FRSSP16_10]|uniref:lipid kinase YegS n=1 Tax=unclassified Vibrio TaxID=2614977 RepID=UPI0007FD12B2|nr:MULTISPECIES: lipid kinase YegS [unclassified Vibrio]OBT16309.1 lipid kinase YegS [Vibrio sp. UCD-FRSSP16_30]OBT21174.1 lipid kinase YegS [Vibrio sp. UCD-FRSSP16_10]
MKVRLLLNGKKASLATVREAVFAIRADGTDLEVRPTWEAGDIDRLVQEAVEQNCDRLIAGGGDGTINEVVNALMKIPKLQRPELAVLPLGTANDFATSCLIPTQLEYDALKLAISGESHYVDVIKAGSHYFMNMATGGFGAQVTATTPVALKNFLGGGAYTLTGLVQALNFQPFSGQVIFDNNVIDSNVIVGAVCNGRQAGGGQVLSPNSFINDGKMEVISLSDFPKTALPLVLQELNDPKPDGQYVRKIQVESIEWQADTLMPINLDGEPITSNKIKFEVCASQIKMVLPAACPLLK